KIVMPTDVKVKLNDGSEHHLTLDMQKRIEEYDTGLQGKIESVVIDPDEKRLDIDRVNNSWPRKVNFKPVPLYFPLYDIPIFLPENGYNVVVGPEIISNGLGLKASFQKPYDYIIYAASGYEFDEELHNSRAGFELNNFLHSQTALGAEVSNRTDLGDGSEDLVSE